MMEIDLKTENDLLREHNHQLTKTVVDLTLKLEASGEPNTSILGPREAVFYTVRRFGADYADVIRGSKVKTNKNAREASAWVLRNEYGLSYPEITMFISRTSRNHSSAIALVRRANKEVDSGSHLGNKIQEVAAEIRILKCSKGMRMSGLGE